MKTLKIGIMPKEQYQKRVVNIAAGKYKPKSGEPKIWFSSMKSMAEVLSDNNIRLLRLIADKEPDSIKSLAEISGRKPGNLSRTLHTMERYGIVDLKKSSDSKQIKPVAKATQFSIQTMAF